MIAFDLECSEGHQFEGWFENHDSYLDQKKKKMISCPYCNKTKVKKILSPIKMKKRTESRSKSIEEKIDYGKLAKEVVEYIQTNFEDLGSDFTKEALKIHYGVSEKRNIRGTASEEEEKVLKDEGIQFIKLPIPIDDKDKKN